MSQGLRSKLIGAENFTRVREYMGSHLGCTNVECSKALGINVMSVGRYVHRIRAEWADVSSNDLPERSEK